MEHWLVFVLAALGVARATRLVTTDTILDLPREWLSGLRFTPEAKPHSEYSRPRVHELLTCNWCTAAWLAGGMWAILEWRLSLPMTGLWWPALGWAGGWLAGRE